MKPQHGISTAFPFSALSKKLLQLTGALLLWSCATSLVAQTQTSRIANEIAGQHVVFQTLKPVFPLRPFEARTLQVDAAKALLPGATFYSMHPASVAGVMTESPAFLRMELPVADGSLLKLRLKRADIFSSSFQLFTASDPGTPYPYERGGYYWGVVEDVPGSLVALAFTQDEIMGFIQLGDRHFTLGKLGQDQDHSHILYETDELEAKPGVNCFIDDSHDLSDQQHHEIGGGRDATNCVRMYIQVDYDIFVQKGGVQQAADYVNGAFSQVALLYDNEAINLVVNEMLVWNVADPFTGPSTSNYLDQFRNYLNGNYNGDLAHLVGYGGGGGIAYLDVLCNSYYGVGYSGINSSYQNVPTYSWTIEVLTHEIGHNLGSPHTHACAWNGNNTAIDGCGPAAGYSEGCNAPLPASGTIMSYCHLIGGVGINFNNGFGPQPGDRIRTEVYNATCLASCGPPIQFDAGITAISNPIAFPCENNTAPVVTLKNFGAATLTNVTIQYQLDNGAVSNYGWSGTLTQNQTASVTLPVITYATGNHTLKVNTANPNGQPDEVPSNDQSTKTFTYYVDWCICNAATANLSPNPLTHTGSGSSSASVSFAPGSKKPAFTISNLNAKTTGPQNSRFIDIVTVTYVDGGGTNKTYGTFSGAQQSTVNVSILDFVNSISVSLSNGLSNGYNGTLSVSFTSVNYCSPVPACPDADNDGVCDANDVCPGFNDNLIGTSCNDNDPCTQDDVYTPACVCAGTPIPNCPPACNEVTNTFSPNPLTHVGPGQSTSAVSLSVNNTDAAFTISNLGARTSGNPNGRYIEQVTVNYVNGNGNTVTYGIFRGDQVSTVNVTLAGVVQSITLILVDAYDGNSSTQLSVNMTAVTSCNNGGALIGPSDDESIGQVTIFPNPTSNDVLVRWENITETTTIRVFNTLGVMLGMYSFHDVNSASIPLSLHGGAGNQLLFLAIEAGDQPRVLKRVILIQ